jgi:hypothetical protein
MDEPRILEKGSIPTHLLQHELVDVLQLALQAKQAQWSLRDQGTGLTRSLSNLSTSCLVWADQVAIALSMADVPPDGRVSTVAKSPNIVWLEPKWRDEKEVAELAVSRCRMFAAWAEERSNDPAIQGTPNSHIFTSIAEDLRRFSPATPAS